MQSRGTNLSEVSMPAQGQSLISRHNFFFKKYIILNDELVLLQVGFYGTCRLASSSLDTAKPRKLPTHFDYASLVQGLRNLVPLTRSNDKCTSSVCRKSRETLHSLWAIPKSTPVSRSPTVPLSSRDLTQLCSFCFRESGLGKLHECNPKKELDNLDKALPPKSKDQFASNHIKYESDEVSTSGVVKLSIGGWSMLFLTVLRSPEDRVPISPSY